MSTGLQYDQEASGRLLAVYLTPDVAAQRLQVLHSLGLRLGEWVLDVGSGPGFLAATMGETVGSSGRVCGVDISEPLLAMSRARCAQQPWVEFRHGEATQLPFPDDRFDAGVSTQVYEYVADVDAALRELYRVLRPGGRAAILDTDWDSIVWHSPNQGRMNRVLAAWDEHAAHPHLPRTLAGRLRCAGFEVRAPQILPLFNPRWEADTYSNRMIDLIAPFVAGRRGITEEEARAWAEELRDSAAADGYFFSLNRYLFVAVKPARPTA